MKESSSLRLGNRHEKRGRRNGLDELMDLSTPAGVTASTTPPIREEIDRTMTVIRYTAEAQGRVMA